MPSESPQPTSRLELGLNIACLLGRCFQLNWVNFEGVFLAASMLGGDNFTINGHSQALYTLLGSAGDKICKSSNERRVCGLVDDLSEMLMWGKITKKEDIDLLEVRSFLNEYRNRGSYSKKAEDLPLGRSVWRYTEGKTYQFCVKCIAWWPLKFSTQFQANDTNRSLRSV